MTIFTRAIISLAVVGALFGTFAFFGLTPFGKTIVEQVVGSTTQGTTGNTARQANIYGVNLAAPGANATSSSILNPTGQDVYVTAIKVGCEGVGTSKTAYSGTGLASLTFSVATTSTAAPAAQGANTINGGTFTIGTSTSYYAAASSTAVLNGSYTIIWGAGSYLTFFTNATNTAICTFGVDYFQS